MILYKGLFIYPIEFFNSGTVRSKFYTPFSISEYGCGVRVSYNDLMTFLNPNVESRLAPSMAMQPSVHPTVQPTYPPMDPLRKNGPRAITLITSPVTIMSSTTFGFEGVKTAYNFSELADLWHASDYEVEYAMSLGADLFDIIKVLWKREEFGIVDMISHFERFPVTASPAKLSEYEHEIEKRMISALRTDEVRKSILEKYKDNIKVF